MRFKRFRETLWFKKGVLDAQTAVHMRDAQVVEEPAPNQEVVDSLPIEDRYLDDGTLSRDDTLQFGVHTGTTRTIAYDMLTDESGGVGERALVSEMKRGRRLYLALVAAGVVLLTGAVVLFG